ncbi:hypothetical protein EV121DRAFT_165685, partial [Schizophyllum commune]
MEYKHYDRKIVITHGVTLDGWPATIEFKNPSELSTALAPLQLLHDNLKNGTIRWRRLSSAVLAQRRSDWDDRVARGEVEEPVRKQRKDAGQKRKRPGGKKAAPA